MMRPMLPSTARIASILLLPLALAACGDDSPSSDAAVNGTDAPVTPGEDGGENIIDAPVPTPDAPQAACTPVKGTNVGVAQVANGFENPVLATAPVGDPRLFVVEQPGAIRIIENPLGDAQVRGTPFLDLRETGRIDAGGNEQGLLGLAFHPQYATNGRFFVFYTAVNPNNALVIAEYHVSSSDPNVADTAERRLIEVNHNTASNHNGGMVDFGSDGYLYFGTGDGGEQGDPFHRAQDPQELRGKILRIDVDQGDPYGIPAGNPYADGKSGKPEIWALGLRNPFRFSFDRQTGDFYVGDVGQDSIEEVSVYPASSKAAPNFGWSTWEGDDCFREGEGDPDDCAQHMDGMTFPFGTHSHGDNWASVIGGAVYRGTCFPDLDGQYYYTDFYAADLWHARFVGGQIQGHEQIVPNFVDAPSSIHNDGFGEIFITAHQDGVVFRLVVEP
jgi:glucose/arabinose dehydrogenase